MTLAGPSVAGKLLWQGLQLTLQCGRIHRGELRGHMYSLYAGIVSGIALQVEISSRYRDSKLTHRLRKMYLPTAGH